MEVREIMSKKLITVGLRSSIRDAAKKMLKHDISGLVVVNSGFQIQGIISSKDILKAFAAGKKPDMEVQKIMKKEVITVKSNETLEGTASIMVKHKIKRLPVVSGGKCVGIVTASDLVKYEEHLLDKLSLLFLLPQKTTQAG